FGTPPLSAELRTGNAAAMPRQATKTASLRVFSVTSKSPPWLCVASCKRRRRPEGYASRCSFEQPDLAEDRDGGRVDVLSVAVTVLEGDHVDAAPLDSLAGRLGDQVSTAHRVRVRGGRRPLLSYDAIADIKAPCLEANVGPGLEDRADVLADLATPR